MGNHLYENGDWIFISNSIIEGKTNRNFYPFDLESKNKKWGSNKDLDLKYPIVLDLLKEVIPEQANKTGIMDVELSTEETLGIKTIFEREINHLLSIRKPTKMGYNITVFGKEIQVDTRNQAVTDGRLRAFNDIYLIAKECLDENKPMYLSID
jgi:hypothetical protein